MLRYVKNINLDLELLADFPDEAESLLQQNTEMPKKRSEEIAQTIREKIEYLSMFQNGKKIWKREKYR